MLNHGHVCRRAVVVVCAIAMLGIGAVREAQAEAAEFVVTDYGAQPDNEVLDTAGIQAAIDACAEAGGGAVRIPAGRFLSGGLHLRDNIRLVLDEDAVLEGSSDYQDYGGGDWTDALITGDGVRNIAIEGPGKIDGVDCENPDGEEGFRGPHAIYLTGASDISIRELTIVNAGNYAILCRDSTDAEIVDVSIRGGHDGLQAQDCARFSVRDCDFRTGDDCFAGCDNVDFEIINCKINSSCNGFRLGCVNLVVEGCEIWGPGEYPHLVTTRDGGEGRTNMLSAFTHFAPEDRDPQLPSDNWLIKDSTIENVGFVYGYDFEGGLWQTGQPAKNLRFESIQAVGIAEPMRVLGDEGRQFELTLDGVTIELEERDADRPVLDLTRFGALNLHNVTLRNMGDAPVLRARDGDSVRMENVTAEPANDGPFDFENVGVVESAEARRRE